jgi:hypothetical protein
MDQKAKQFVQRLLANPALNSFTPLQKEEQILAFLRMNAQQLYPTLASASFFPGKSWNEIYKILVEALYEISDEAIAVGIRDFFGTTINFHYVSFFSGNATMTGDRETVLHSLVMKMVRHPLARRGLTGPYAALVLRMANRYLDRVYEDRSYIRFELEKVQRLAMSQKEVKNLVRTSLLLKPAVLLYQSSQPSGTDAGRGLVPFAFAHKVKENLEKQLSFLPHQVLESALFSNVSFDEKNDIPATSRLAAIFSLLARDYRPGLKVDRGAASQERSWLGVARLNHRHFGFDMKMVDELYRLAAENGW